LETHHLDPYVSGSIKVDQNATGQARVTTGYVCQVGLAGLSYCRQDAKNHLGLGINPKHSDSGKLANCECFRINGPWKPDPGAGVVAGVAEKSHGSRCAHLIPPGARGPPQVS